MGFAPGALKVKVACAPDYSFYFIYFPLGVFKQGGLKIQFLAKRQNKGNKILIDLAFAFPLFAREAGVNADLH